MLKLQYLAELVVINLKYVASNTSLMILISAGYLQILSSGYPDSKFTIRFSPIYFTIYIFLNVEISYFRIYRLHA